MADILNAPANALNAPAAQDPIVAPPIYGSTYPPKERVEVAATPRHWVNDLNLDPRDRIAASFGVRIVQEDQEHLMASAWQQVDAIEKENEERRRKQLAATTRQSTWVRHVRPIEDDGLLQVTGLSLAKVAVSVQDGQTSIQRTVAWQLNGSQAPGFESATLRRVARPRGPINRRALTPAVVQNQTFARPMVKLTQTLPPVDRIVITRSAANFCRPDGDDQECLGCCADASIRFGETDVNDHQHCGAASRVDDPRDARSRVSRNR